MELEEDEAKRIQATLDTGPLAVGSWEVLLHLDAGIFEDEFGGDAGTGTRRRRGSRAPQAPSPSGPGPSRRETTSA